MGYNNYRGVNSPIHGTIHAEIDAMSRLPYYFNNKKRKKKLDLIVIRINLHGELRQSKPCIHCIKYLNRMKNYTIRYVYYSNNDGLIVRTNFNTLYNECINGIGHITYKNK